MTAIFDDLLGPVSEPRRPDEFTAVELAENRGVSISRATAILSALLESGAVTRRPVKGNRYLYRRADERTE